MDEEMVEKLSYVLTFYFSMYTADMIERAILDEDISLADFKKGFDAVSDYDGDDDEYTPFPFS